MNYLLDTNVILGFLKQGVFSQYLQDTISFPSRENIYAISIVTLGELKSLALQRKWGKRKLNELDGFLSELLILDIFSEDIVEKYAEIDAYSQGKLPNHSLPTKLTSRNMGKNDLWIAATAAVTKATLITTDRDFDHLSPYFIDLEWVDITIFRT